MPPLSPTCRISIQTKIKIVFSIEPFLGSFSPSASNTSKLLWTCFILLQGPRVYPFTAQLTACCLHMTLCNTCSSPFIRSTNFGKTLDRPSILCYIWDFNPPIGILTCTTKHSKRQTLCNMYSCSYYPYHCFHLAFFEIYQTANNFFHLTNHQIRFDTLCDQLPVKLQTIKQHTFTWHSAST